MMILNDGNLVYSEGFYKMLALDNTLIDRLKLENEDDKLFCLFKMFKETNKLHQFVTSLDITSIDRLYSKFREDMNEEDQSSLFNNAKLTQFYDMLFKQDNEIDQESLVNLLDEQKTKQLYFMSKEEESLGFTLPLMYNE